MKPFPAWQCSWVWILCTEMLQGSLLIACISARSTCLAACRAQAGRRAGASRGSALAYCCQASRTQPGPKRSEIPARRSLYRAQGGGGRGEVRAVPDQPQSTVLRRTARPPHSPASPTRTDPASREPTYWAADLWGGGGACVCSKQINPGTLLTHRQGSKKLSKAEHRSETIFLNRLFILPFKSMLSREKAELQKHLICVFQRCHIT